MRYLWGGKLTHFNRKQQWHFLWRAHETRKYTSTYKYTVLVYAIFHFTWVVLNSGDDFKGYTIFISSVTPSAFKPRSLSYKIIKHYRIFLRFPLFKHTLIKMACFACQNFIKFNIICSNKCSCKMCFSFLFRSSLNAQVPSFCVMFITFYKSHM